MTGSYVGANFKDASPNETDDFTLDFVKDLFGEAIASATWYCELVNGTDPAPEEHLVDAPVWEGTATTQRIGGLVAGCLYRLRAVVTTAAGATLELYSHVRCLPPA